ncbi:MAG: hypothetical protein ACFCU9_03895 [Cyanophyceae cyanobacterium]
MATGLNPQWEGDEVWLKVLAMFFGDVFWRYLRVEASVASSLVLNDEQA